MAFGEALALQLAQQYAQGLQSQPTMGDILGNQLKSLANYGMVQQTRQQGLQDDIIKQVLKSRIENQMGQERLKQMGELISQFQGGSPAFQSQPGLPMQGSPQAMGQPQGMGLEQGQQINPFIFKPSLSYDPISGDSRMSFSPFENPQFKEQQEIKKEKRQSLLKETEPLPQESATRYSGAIQTINNINKIREKIGLSSGKVTDIKKAKDLIYKANLNIEGTGARPTLIPGLQGFYRGSKLLRGGDEGAELGTLFMTFSENVLRARTGAAAPDPEIIREYARSLLRGFIESPETWESKLNQVEEFVSGTARSIKPNTWEKDVSGFKIDGSNDEYNQYLKAVGQ